MIGTENLLKEIGQGAKIEFDKIICTTEQIGTLKQYARTLGPKGLMPNVKSGTLVKSDQLADTIKQSKQGLIEYRVDEHSFIKNKIGKRRFTDEELLSNLDAVMRSIISRRPPSVKGKYFNRAFLKSSMGPSIKLDLAHYQELAMPE